MRRYKLPLVNAVAIAFVRDALVGPVFAERAWRHAAGEQLPQKIIDAAKIARQILKDIRSGSSDLAGADAAASTDDAATMIVSKNTPEFDRSNMLDY